MPDWRLYPQQQPQSSSSWPATSSAGSITPLRWLLASALTLSALVAIVAIATFVRWAPGDWGAVWGAIGQWMGAIGTVAAVAVALYLARFEAHRERERSREEARQTAVERASLILAEAKPTPPSQADPTTPEWLLIITNHSTDPILSPRLENFLHPDGGAVDWKFDDPGSMWEDYAPPGSVAGAAATRLPVAVIYDPEPSEWRTPVPIISFTDTSGRRWRRTGSSTPVLATDSNSPTLGGPDWYQQH